MDCGWSASQKCQKYFYMLMSYYVNVAKKKKKKENLTNTWCISPIPCRTEWYSWSLLSLPPCLRDGWLYVTFTVFMKATICVFTFVLITGSKLQHSAYYITKNYVLCFTYFWVTPLKTDFVNQCYYCKFCDYAFFI